MITDKIQEQSNLKIDYNHYFTIKKSPDFTPNYYPLILLAIYPIAIAIIFVIKAIID